MKENVSWWYKYAYLPGCAAYLEVPACIPKFFSANRGTSLFKMLPANCNKLPRT